MLDSPLYGSTMCGVRTSMMERNASRFLIESQPGQVLRSPKKRAQFLAFSAELAKQMGQLTESWFEDEDLKSAFESILLLNMYLAGGSALSPSQLPETLKGVIFKQIKERPKKRSLPVQPIIHFRNVMWNRQVLGNSRRNFDLNWASFFQLFMFEVLRYKSLDNKPVSFRQAGTFFSQISSHSYVMAVVHRAPIEVKGVLKKLCFNTDLSSIEKRRQRQLKNLGALGVANVQLNVRKHLGIKPGDCLLIPQNCEKTPEFHPTRQINIEIPVLHRKEDGLSSPLFNVRRCREGKWSVYSQALLYRSSSFKGLFDH